MPRAFFFGAWERPDHYLRDEKGTVIWSPSRDLVPPIPWSESLMDSGLLTNSRTNDEPDGRVRAVPAKGPWIAFIWWDRTGDRRAGSNSGFYVHGFEWDQRAHAFAFACAIFPKIVARQAFPLVLVER